MTTPERRDGNGRRATDEATLAVMARDIKHIREALPTFVTKDEFRPVRAVAYGLVGVLMSALIVVIVASAFG